MSLPPEIAFERFLREKHARGEKRYGHILGRLAVEELPPDHLYRWFAEWMNRQLSDLGVNSTQGLKLPPLRFELVRVNGKQASAHVFEDGGYAYLVMTQPMFDEMLELSRRAVNTNWALMTLQIAPAAKAEEIAQLLLMMQFSFVGSHEYSHLVRQHLADDPPHAAELGQTLSQAQELDADGYALYHELTYFFHGAGMPLIAQLLRISGGRVLENSIVSCFLLSTMLQFCARWAGRIQIESDLSAEHPPVPIRIQRALAVAEMWCREVGKISTSWMAEETLRRYFQMAAGLFSAEEKASWNRQIDWLRSPESEEYREEIRKAAERLRTGKS